MPLSQLQSLAELTGDKGHTDGKLREQLMVMICLCVHDMYGSAHDCGGTVDGSNAMVAL